MTAPLFLALAVLAQGYYTPAEVQSIFSQANDAFGRDELAAAHAGYEKLVLHGHGSPDVLYNLGTTCLAEGDLGNAVLWLERARRLEGRSADIEANLAVARARQLDKVIGGSADEPFLQRVATATRGVPVDALFLASWALAFALAIALRFLSPGRRTLAVVAMVVAFVVAGFLGALTSAQVWMARNVTEAVVLVKEAKALELPKDGAKVSFEVHAGLKVRIVENSGKFARIRLPNGLEGWTERDVVAEL